MQHGKMPEMLRQPPLLRTSHKESTPPTTDMKKWLYFVAPAIMLVIFTFFYFAHAEEVAEKTRIREQVEEEKAQVESDRKARIEEQARVDAMARAAKSKAKAAKKEADRIAKWNNDSQEIEDKTNAHKAEADKHAKAISELEIQLDSLHKAKATSTAEQLNLAKKVEVARIARRNAELEIQRKTEAMVRRAEKSSVTQIPPPPPAVKKRR